jgi:hypothetical protein
VAWATVPATAHTEHILSALEVEAVGIGWEIIRACARLGPEAPPTIVGLLARLEALEREYASYTPGRSGR